jgi:hypothetical protein
MTDTRALTLTDFLLARFAEDEAAVRAIENGFDSDPRAREHQCAEDRGLEWINPSIEWSDSYRLTIPSARILAECEAKRQIVAVYEALAVRKDADRPGAVQWHEADAYRTVLRTLASVYADHPNYRPEWAI